MEIANSPTPCILLISLYNVEVKLWQYQFEFLFSNLNKLGFDGSIRVLKGLCEKGNRCALVVRKLSPRFCHNRNQWQHVQTAEENMADDFCKLTLKNNQIFHNVLSVNL